MTGDTVVKVEVEARVATITLHRPEVRNALNEELRRALPAAVATADQDADVDVIVLTGADPAFCAGLDLKELGRGPARPRRDPGAAPMVLLPHYRGPLPPTQKPVIGAINGVAITGGLELALGCDWLIASEHARFADTHARVGLMPSWGLTIRLPEAVGERRARQMSASGNFVDASTALAWGLVNEVVAHDELLPRCRQLAADIVSNDQRGVRRLMATYDALETGDGSAAWEREAQVAEEFRRQGNGDASEIERRRDAIMQRGRRQAGVAR